MARKKIEPIENLGSMDKLTVQKSRPLFALWRSELTLAEFKILDSYLGRINSHDEEHRTVTFSKGELEALFGLKQIKPEVLDERLKHLMISVQIPDSSHKKGFTRISLFEKAYCEQDEYGQWQVELTCTPSAKKYIFDVEEIGYLRYKLRCVVNMKSRYTYIMFLHIWDNKHRISWEVPLDELRAMLRCDEDKSYDQFKVFNDRILKRIHKEIHAITDIKYDYETVKKGRRVVAIRFTYHKGQTELLEDIDPNQYTIEDWQNSERDNICHGFSSPEFEDFTHEQLELLKDLGWSKKRDSDYQKHKELLNDTVLACEYAVADYLRQTIIMAKTRNPKNLFLYVKKMLEND